MKKQIGICALATAMLLSGAVPAWAGLIDVDGEPAINIDTAPPGTETLALNIEQTGLITDVNVAVQINNPADMFSEAIISDMSIFLNHGSTSLTLFSSNGSAEFGTMDIIFDDEALGEVDETNFETWIGTWRPDTPLSAFDGMDVSGDWTLLFVDNNFEDEGDSLLGWSLIAEYEEPSAVSSGGAGSAPVASENVNQIPVPSTVLLFGLGMVGLGLRRQK